MCDFDIENDNIVPVLLALCDKIVEAKVDKIKSVNDELRKSLADISNAKKIAELQDEIERLLDKQKMFELALLKKQVVEEKNKRSEPPSIP